MYNTFTLHIKASSYAMYVRILCSIHQLYYNFQGVLQLPNVTLCVGGSKGKFVLQSDVAHIGVLQLPWCATTSHWNAYNYARTTNGMHQDCFMQQVKLLLFIKHAILISIVGLSLGAHHPCVGSKFPLSCIVHRRVLI